MIRDAQLLLSSAQAFTIDANTSNVVDTTNIRNIADGTRLSIYIHTTVAADHTTGTETYAFNLVTDDNAALSSATTLLSTTILYSALTANSLNEIAIPEGLTFEEFVAVAFDGSAGDTPTVTCSIWIGKSGNMPSVKTYSSGYSV